MSDLVFRGTPPQYIPIPPTTVREWLPMVWDKGVMVPRFPELGWRPFPIPPDGEPAETRERTVPVTLNLDAECPDCGGLGEDAMLAHLSSHGKVTHRCSTCDCRGVVPTLWLAEQQAVSTDGDWFTADDVVWNASARNERRLAVVARCTVQVLPVVDEHEQRTEYPASYLCVFDDGDVALALPGDGGWVTDEPWAKGLTPGATVLQVGTPTPLDTPITHMLMKSTDVYASTAQRPELTALHKRVSLSLALGLNVVELAR